MSAPTGNDVWPLPKFYFSVSGIPGNPVFQEVTGLDAEAQVIEYRNGNNPTFFPVKMPGLGKVGNVTMKKGVFVSGPNLWSWFNDITMNTIARSTVVIALMDPTGKPQMTWTLNNAFPTKLTGTDLKSDGNEVAVESIEIAFETMTVAQS